MTNEICEYLSWDSSFFGCRIARATRHRADDADADAMLAWCAAQQIDCLYFLAESDDPVTVHAVEQRGFAFVDVRMTLARTAAGARPPAPSTIRLARPEDVPALQALARNNHTDSRFYYDTHFPRERCDALYEAWIARSCEGYADAVLVAERDGGAVGYISCQIAEAAEGKAAAGTIGLLGVAPSAVGLGLGGALIDGALGWFAERGIGDIDVVTQGRNVRAQRAYQRRGFVSKRAQLWYHRWFAAERLRTE